jgi:hypothetical protein
MLRTSEKAKGRQGRDENDSVGFIGESFEDLAGGRGRKVEGLVGLWLLL